MVFGAADAPSTFSLLMRNILRGIKNVVNYLDDLQIVILGWENCLAKTNEVLTRLIEYGVTLSPEKCEFGKISTEILGFMIDRHGIHVCPNKVQAIAQLPRPTNKDQVRSVLGSLVYYRQFVPNLMVILSPLFSLVKKDSHFQWKVEHQNAFDLAKQKLMDTTLRVHRNSKYPLVLISDASKLGCGAVLTQCNGTFLEPLSYYSRQFTKCEQTKPIRWRELYGIYYAIRNYQSILIAEEFSVLSDHQSLQYLKNTATNELNIRLYNILDYLSYFMFKVLHIPGRDKRMATADLLSRAPYFLTNANTEDNEDEKDPTAVVEKINTIDARQIPSLNYANLVSQQENDPYCQVNKNSKHFVTKDAVLFKQSGSKQLIVLPESCGLELLTYLHCKRGHLRAKKLYNYIKE